MLKFSLIKPDEEFSSVASYIVYCIGVYEHLLKGRGLPVILQIINGTVLS